MPKQGSMDKGLQTSKRGPSQTSTKNKNVGMGVNIPFNILNFLKGIIIINLYSNTKLHLQTYIELSVLSKKNIFELFQIF